MPPFILYEVYMNVRQLINRAFMQIGDTLQEKYTPYQLLEYYNVGNQILNGLIARLFPDLRTISYTARGRGRIQLPEQAVTIRGVKADNKEVSGYQSLNMQTIVFDAEDEQDISVDYVKTAGYKQFTDDSDYPAELESLLVDYIVTRVMDGDLSGVVANMTSILQSLADGASDSNGYVLAKGYFDYDNPRIDYSD